MPVELDLSTDRFICLHNFLENDSRPAISPGTNNIHFLFMAAQQDNNFY